MTAHRLRCTTLCSRLCGHTLTSLERFWPVGHGLGQIKALTPLAARTLSCRGTAICSSTSCRIPGLLPNQTSPLPDIAICACLQLPTSLLSCKVRIQYVKLDVLCHMQML